MRVMAALLGAAAVYLTVALTLGVAPNVAVRSASRPQVSKRQLWLIQAGSDLTPRQFRLGSIAGALVTFALLWLLTQSMIIALVPSVAAGFLPSGWYGKRRQDRIAEIQAAWPDGIRDLLAHVTSGATLGKAVEALATEGPLPFARRLRPVPAPSADVRRRPGARDRQGGAGRSHIGQGDRSDGPRPRARR